MLRINAAFGRLKLTSPAERLIHLTFATIFALCFLLGCETANYAPSITQQMAVASSRKQDVDVVKLEHGRNLFVHRCIECHTLPAIWHYTPKDWTEVVDSMAHRASLKPAERDAVIAYILTVRKRM